MIFDADAMAQLIAQKVAAELEQSIGDDILDTEGAALLLKRSPDTVQDLAARGEIPARKVGRAWAFRRSALLNHITDNAQLGERQSLQLAGD